MDIVISTDNNYFEHSAALIFSIVANNSGEITIHMINNQVSDISFEKLKSNLSIFPNVRLLSYPMNKDMFIDRVGMGVSADRSISAYFRLLIPDLLDNNVKRALYLDVDGIVCSSLSDLFEINMNGKPIGAVQDLINPTRKLKIGLDKNCKYVNSGVMLLDLELCRKLDLSKRCIDFIRSYNGEVDAMDQGTINGVLKGDFLFLDPKWNVLTPFYQMSVKNLLKYYSILEYYDQEKIYEAIKHPGFVHFVPNFVSRPWVKGCKHPMKLEYKYYRNLCGFPIKTLEADTRSLKIKFASYMFHLLPFDLFMYIFKSK